MRDYKIVVLGAGGVGKSALTVQFVQGVYIESYDPTIEDSYRKVTEIDQRPCTLEILDTAGVEQFTAMRELYIKNGQGFILVYSVNNKDSLRELLELREQIIRIKDNANVPMVLVANKSDLEEQREVTPEMGVQVANSWGRTPFYETSAKYCLNVEQVFTDLVRQIMRRDSAFGCSVTNSFRGHSFQNSIDDTYSAMYSHQKRVSASSNHSSTSGISTNTANANLNLSYTNSYGYSNNNNNNNNNSANNNNGSSTGTPAYHASSMFKLKTRSKSKENMPRYTPQQELTPTQMQQLRILEQQQEQAPESQQFHKLNSKISRNFKKPHPSKSMPALRKPKKSLTSGGTKEKDCIIC